jgi:DNA-binding PadR family transcriptional regulator
MSKPLPFETPPIPQAHRRLPLSPLELSVLVVLSERALDARQVRSEVLHQEHGLRPALTDVDEVLNRLLDEELLTSDRETSRPDMVRYRPTQWGIAVVSAEMLRLVRVISRGARSNQIVPRLRCAIPPALFRRT